MVVGGTYSLSDVLSESEFQVAKVKLLSTAPLIGSTASI